MAQKSGISILIGFLSKLILLVVLLAVGAGVWGIMEEPNQLRFTPVKVGSAQWPLHWQPVDVIVMSDLHVGSPHVDIAKLESIVRLVNQAEPEVVLLLGSFMPADFFKTPIAPEEFAPVLGRIQAKFGVFALPGRLDALDGGKALVDALRKQKITVLSDSAAPVQLAKGQRFWIAGFGDDPARYQNVMAKLPNGEPVLAMVHNPARFPDIPAKIDTVFAGYTHGGLIRIPEVPMPLLPTGVPKKYAYGLVVEEDRRMFVTGGIGTGEYPIRLNNIPEIVLATILPQQ